jgi:chaperone modulatory protein CbpM
MSQYQWISDDTQAELLDEQMLELADVARICCVNDQWLLERIEQEVVQPIVRDDRYYFTSATVVRIQRVIHVEQVYDADPQLAALVADLTEEVQRLRNELKRLPD